MADKWYKNAITYGIDVKLFQDSNNNGFGDFKGLTSRIGYLKELGINCIWLMPFYPSPLRDYGYDVSDFFSVDPRLGTMHDFLNFMEACHKADIRVLIDLIMNHTSIEHPWFIQSKSDRNSPFREYYVWRDEKPDEQNVKIMFEGVEDSIWEYAAETNSYYLHSYYKEQADLNLSNPAVTREIFRIVKFWLQLGVSGFRIDAAHTLMDTNSISQYHNIFKELRDYAQTINPEAVLLGEADVKPKELTDFFGEGDRIHMLFNFFTNQYLFLALAREEAKSLKKGLDLSNYTCGHSLNFIRHHDELNVLQLSEKERKEVLEKFAPEPEMRVFNDGGIKRELPSMLEGDHARIKFTYVALFSLPGSPMIHFGEELGMGEDLNRNIRAAVRIPMQWNDQLHGGFSKAPVEKISHPPLFHGQYSYKKINVAQQQNDPDSLFHFMVNLIKIRKSCTEIGEGSWEYATPKNENNIFAILYTIDESHLLIALNFSSKKQQTELSLPFEDCQGVDVLADSEYGPYQGKGQLKINPYGYRWTKFSTQSKII